MRHQISGHQFNRDSNARKGLLLSLVSNLALHGEITTTRPMAKETSRQMDKLITKAKKADIASRRVLHKFFGKRRLVNLMVDQIAPTFPDKISGFTAIAAVGERRGDATPMYSIKFVTPIIDRTKPAVDKFKQIAKKPVKKPAAKSKTKKA